MNPKSAPCNYATLASRDEGGIKTRLVTTTGGGGGGGVTTYIFLTRMYPGKTKGEPKAGAGFLINYEPKSGANNICYKNATQSRGNLVSVLIDILFDEKPAEKNGSRTTYVPTPGRFFYFE